MRFPKVRMTINAAESLLLMPGLDTVVNGLAGAKLGVFPHRHPYDRIDPVASAVYENQAYNDGMAARVVALRGKLREMPQSRKIRVDAVDLAAAGFALRLWKAHKPSNATEESSAAVKRLQKKIEKYRLRAKRAAIKKFGKISYQDTAKRWRRFAAWAKYHLLYFKLPNLWGPRRAKFWREQRQQLTLAFATALKEDFFEVPSDVEMVKLVTLASRSLRRSRHPMSLRELLRAPQSHAEFLVAFVVKRVELRRLPGAPVSPAQAMFDRADMFHAYEERRAKAALSRSTARPCETIAGSNTPNEAIPLTAIPTSQFPTDQKVQTEELVRLTGVGLLNSITKWLYQTVTMDFAQGVCTEARSQISNQLLDQYRGPTIAITYEGQFERLMSESRPAEFSTHRSTMARQYAGWVLRCLLTLRQEPAWMSYAIGVALGRAKEMEDEDHHAECLAAISNGRHSAPVHA